MRETKDNVIFKKNKNTTKAEREREGGENKNVQPDRKNRDVKIFC